ncbi:MAG TPA: hypothetical protein G4O18_06040 [Dehalococcoidia bacterium]|nr:hypothetical protein [Dehalococcoidia bacterium]
MDVLHASVLSSGDIPVSKVFEVLKKRKGIGDLAEIQEQILASGRQPLDLTTASKRIGTAYRNEKLVLILGSGVSKDYGMPTWKGLLQKLLGKTFESESADPEKASFMSEMFDMIFGPDPLIAARRLALHFTELEKEKHKTLLFENAVRDILYEEVSNQNPTPLFEEIVQFCVAPGRSYNLDSIVSYNYDDLLETHLKNLGVSVPFTSIFSAGQNPKPNQLPIYHVHGYLLHSGRLTKDNTITLGDDAYHSQYSDVYRWSNLVQINKFVDCNCLFIGTSFTDPNQRRLLDIARQQRGTNDIQHFLIKKRYSTIDTERALINILNTNDHTLDESAQAELAINETVEDLISAIHMFETYDAHSFNVEVIWVNEYSDIPQILKEIRESSYD